jgi:hypothetical protein
VLAREPGVRAEHVPRQLLLALVHHDLVQLVVLQRRVEEPLLHLRVPRPLLRLRSVALRLGLLRRGFVESEPLLGRARHVDLEDGEEDDGGCGGDGVEPALADESGGYGVSRSTLRWRCHSLSTMSSCMSTQQARSRFT